MCRDTRGYHETKVLTPSIDELMRFENGEMDDAETVELFQRLVDTGLAWQLQSWADGDRLGFSTMTDALPAVLDTNFSDWQERVDNPNEMHDIGGFITYLHRITATEYETITQEDGSKLSRPKADARVRTYLVTAEGGYRAMDTVRAYLKRQAPGKQFAFGSSRSITILHGAK